MSSHGIADGDRFHRRGRSLEGAVVAIDVSTASGGRDRIDGVRVTSTLVLTLDAPAAPRAGMPGIALAHPGTTIAIAGAAARLLWSVPGGAALVRTGAYDGALPELSLRSAAENVVVVFHEASGGPICMFGVSYDGTRHDAPVPAGRIGSPVFDEAWSLVGLHRPASEGVGEGVDEIVSLGGLLRALEDSPHWDEIAQLHRLVRTAPRAAPVADAPVERLDRAVRWDPDDDHPLPGRDRRAALRGASLDDLRRARGTSPASGPEQRAIDAILAGPPFDPDRLAARPVDELLAFATAARWFDSVVPGLPDAAALERVIHHRRRRAALDAIVGPHFAPRGAALARLAAWLADPGRPPLVVRGPGGIGKSALLARFIQEACPPARFAWVDFDRPDVSADEATLQRVVDEHLAWQPGDGTLVVVLDSFETSVQTYGYAQLNPALAALARRFPDLGVIVGSRVPVPLLRLEGRAPDDYELTGLPADTATQWLIEEHIAPEVAAGAAAVAAGVPLNLWLARHLLAGKPADQARALLADLPRQLVTGYLYRRILRRLNDDTLRHHAQWAMVARRLVPELLAAILNVPADEAARLFAALRREVTLLDGDAVLAIRPDLRNTLLPLLEADDAARVREIDEIAAAFWARRAGDDLAAAGEAVYHALRVADLGRAGACWRSGVERYLLGYTLDEIPASARRWLESRVALQSTEEDVSSHLARGDVVGARDVLADGARQVRATSHGARWRSLHELGTELSPVELGLDAFEAEALERHRPAYRIRSGDVGPLRPPWDFLDAPRWRERLRAAIAAVGQLRLADGERVLGTATLVGPGRFLTTRSAVAPFVVGLGTQVRLVPDRPAVIDLRAEGEEEGEGAGAGAGERYLVDRAVLVHPYWDIALIGATAPAGAPARLALALVSTEPEPGSPIVAIGHPGEVAPELAHLRAAIYDDVVDAKRVMPGAFLGRHAELCLGREVQAGRDDSSTVSADPGAAVIDPATGALLGVRFATEYLRGNSFAPAWELARDAHLRAGLALGPSPAPVPDWMSAWSIAPSPRQLLLDAYVARREGDLARARAILDVVPGELEPRHRVDRALLEAACWLQDRSRDRSRAGAILEELVTTAELAPEDVDAIVATRLRIAVDAQAERTVLALAARSPAIARLVSPSSFRVLVPDLAIGRTASVAGSTGTPVWGAEADAMRDALRAPAARRSLEAAHGRAAIRAAERILVADAECRRLGPWAGEHGDRLLSLDFRSRSAGEARALAAALVGLDPGAIRTINEILLEMTDLEPHPIRRWRPILQPVRRLLHASRSASAAVNSDAALSAWLDEHVRTGRLGAYLSQRIDVETSVAWAAGLLHLLTPLPIEALLERRFVLVASVDASDHPAREAT